MQITIYQTEAEGPKKFLAHMDLGNQIYMSFFGATRAAAMQRANDFYNRERARRLRLDASAREVATTPQKLTSNSPIKPQGPSGKDGGFAGMVWVINHVTRHKLRVLPDQVAKYEANGFVRGGPRIAFRGD